MNLSRALLAVMILFNLALVALLYGYRELTDMLLATNARAIEQQHAVRDCTLTPWYNADGSITVIVNGTFPHRIETQCRKF